MDRSLSTHAEIANRHWSPLHPERFRRLGNGSGCHLAPVHRKRRNLVWFDRRSFQAAPSARVWT